MVFPLLGWQAVRFSPRCPAKQKRDFMDSEGDFQHYLRSAARKYGNMWFAHEIEEFLNSISKGQLSELRECYERIRSSGDADRISGWIDFCFTRRDEMPKSQFEFSQQVGKLLGLFARLGQRGYEPFSDGTVRYKEPARIPNWNNLPAEFAYLKEPAARYGVYQTEPQILEFLDIATEEDMEALATLAEQIRLKGDWDAIIKWVNSLPDNEESWRVYWLLGMLDHAGLA